MKTHRRLTFVFVCFTALAGCSDHKKPVDSQMPAPKDPPAVPAYVPQKVDPALQAAARAQIDALLKDPWPVARAHAIEAMQETAGVAAKQVYLDGLNDADPRARFAAAMAVGALQIQEAKDELQRAINDPDERVGIAVRYALHRLGDFTYSKDLQESARSPDVQVRAITAQVFGLLKEPSAVKILKPMQKDGDSMVRLQVAEALWLLGRDEGLKSLVAASQSAFADEQMVAIPSLALPRDRRVMGHIRADLTADYFEVQLVAAREMGNLGSDAGFAIAQQGVTSKDSRQRALAALALGAIGRSDAQPLLAPLLQDSGKDVRLSAAKAILQLKNP